MKMSGEKAIHRQELERGLLTQKISRLFLKYTIPGVAGLLFLGIQSVIDGVILGRFVGANALASVNLILPCYSLMTALSIVIGVGCQTLIGINLGRLDRQEANNAITTSFLFLGGISVLISGLIYIFAGDIARMLGANDVLVTGAVDYIRSLVPCFPLLSLMFLGDYMIKAMGALFNIPRMFQRGQVVVVQRGRFRWPLVWNALYNGSSEGISELSAGITIFLFNITMMRYLGEDGVAAFTAINYILFIATTVFLGISDGIIPIISYNFGAGRLDRIEKVLRLAGRVNFMIGITLFAILFFFGQQITSFFFKGGEALDALAIANYGITIYCFTFLMSGLNILASSYFTAIGNAKLSVVISMLRSLVFVTFGIIVYPSLFGIQSIWYNVPVAELCTLFISFMLVRRELLKEAVLKN